MFVIVILAKADMVGTIILNPSALSSAHLSIAEDEKIYHLVNYSNCTIICFYLAIYYMLDLYNI